VNGTETVIVQDVGLTFTIQLFATLIGAFVGFGLAIFWEWKAKHTELKNLKKRILDSMLSEIIQMQEGLKKEKALHWDHKTRDFVGFYTTSSFTSFDTALHSGNLVHFSTELQIKLAILNNSIKREQMFTAEMLTFYKVKFLKDDELKIEADRLVNSMRIAMNGLKDDIEKSITFNEI